MAPPIEIPGSSEHEMQEKSESLDRAEALFEVLRIEIRENLSERYELNLGEMYSLIDYHSAMREMQQSRLSQIDYSGALQRFVSCLIKGEDVPNDILSRCPHHARMYRDKMSDHKYAFGNVREIVNSISVLLDNEEDAGRFLEEYVDYMVANNSSGWDRERSREVCLQNIGYCAGYLDMEAVFAVNRLIGATHVAFG